MKEKTMDDNTQKSISLTIVSPNHTHELLKRFDYSGFDCVELNLNIAVNKHFNQRQADATQKKLLRNLKKTTQAIANYECAINSCHIPFGYDLDISAPNEKARQKAVRKVAKIVKNAECTGANYFVFHPGSPEWVKGSGRRIMLKESERQARLDSVIKSFTELSRITDVKLAVENMPANLLASTPEEQIYIIDTVNQINRNQGFADKQIGAVVDVNHCGEASPEETILALNDRIVGFHLSDKKEGAQDQHMAIGTGDLNWNGIFSAMEEIGFEGAITDESRATTMIPSSWHISLALNKFEKSKMPEEQQEQTEQMEDPLYILSQHLNSEDYDPDQLQINFDEMSRMQ